MTSLHSVADQALPAAPQLDAIAEAFVQARLSGASVADFPGEIPPDLVTAYQVQDRAIARWPDRVVGWKVGFIGAERRDGSGDERLLGPIFAAALQPSLAGNVGFEIFEGGFGAVEAEFVLRLEADMPDQAEWTLEQAEALPSTLHMGVEVASSPLATINKLGPRVVVSDFGNNNGLIMGPEITDWRSIPEPSLTCRTYIDGELVGSGGATTLPGGLRAAIAFALARTAARGRLLKAGDLIATGNATGIHDIAVGQQARVTFDGYGDIVCHALAARDRAATPAAGGQA